MVRRNWRLAVALRLIRPLTWRQKHDYVAVDAIAFEVALQRRSMDFDTFCSHGPCAWHRLGNLGGDLRKGEERDQFLPVLAKPAIL